MKKPLLLAVCFLGAIPLAAGLAIALGGPGDPPAMPSINNPFKGVDYSDLPAARHFTARDGAKLAYRKYAPHAGSVAKGSIVLVHGSSASGSTMHVMAKAFAAAGYAAYAPDVRGHGGSGRKGAIAYVGQLEDDLEDFMRAVSPARPATLAGFSSGGGFALRFAGGARQKLFSSYLLLSPFLGRDAPTARADAGRWASVGVSRYVALSILDAAGLRMFNDLPVVRFALNEEARRFLTSEYSYALAKNFGPGRDYRTSIRALGQPLRVVAGRDDELFYAERFADVFKAAGRDVPVTLVSGTGHISLILGPAAVEAALAAVRSLQARDT